MQCVQITIFKRNQINRVATTKICSTFY